MRPGLSDTLSHLGRPVLICGDFCSKFCGSRVRHSAAGCSGVNQAGVPLADRYAGGWARPCVDQDHCGSAQSSWDSGTPMLRA